LSTTPSTTPLSAFFKAPIKINTNWAIIKHCSTNIFDRIFSILPGVVQYEAEAAGGLGVLVESHDDLPDLAGAGEELIGLLLRGVEGHVPDVHRHRRLQRRLVLLLRPGEPPVPVRGQLGRVLEEGRHCCGAAAARGRAVCD
jgi:hypothetical protein